MERPWVLGLTLAACLALSVSAVAQGNYRVETIGAPASSDVPKALADALEAQGARLAGDQGVLCEVWLRKAVPLQAAAGESGEVLYGALGNGSVLGALHFPSTAADFRGQPIKPGYYVMRYALIPQDGAHMGVYATRDTVLLSPVAADTEIDKNLRFDDLVKLSRLASGTPHPAFLVMSSVSEGEVLPSVAKDDQGHWNLQLKVKGQSGELPIAITLVGKWEGV
jgi:hypothetical protein